MTVSADVALPRAAQAAYALLYEHAPYPPSTKPLRYFGPFANVIQELRAFHQQVAQLSATNGKVYDVWADSRAVWEGMRSSDDGSKQYGLLDKAIQQIAWALADDSPTPSTIVARTDAPLAAPAEVIHKLSPITANDLMAMDIPAPRQFVPGLIREGLSFFIGQPGVGKTPALVQLAIALATGGLWMGVFRVPKIRVAYIGPEYDRGDIRNIIMESTGGQASLVHLLLFTIENFRGPQTEEEALNLIDQLVTVHRVEAIIIDLFPGFLPPEKFKQNAYRGDYREFLAYHRATLAHHIMMTGAWHGTKRDANPATMYNGGQGFWGAAGGGRLVMYQDEEEQIKLWAQLRGNKPIAYTVSESRLAGCRTWAILEGSIPEPAFGSDIHRAIYRTIREHAPAHGLTPKVIAGLVRPDLTSNVNDAYIRKCIAVLHKRGLLRTIGDSYVTAMLGSSGSQGSEGSQFSEGSEGSEGSGAWYEPECTGDAQTVAQDVSRFRSSDPSAIPGAIPTRSATECAEPRTDPSDPSLLAIPADPVSATSMIQRLRERKDIVLSYLRSNKEADQERAQELCTAYGMDYRALKTALRGEMT